MRDLALEVPCKATGIPEPDYYWEKDGVELDRTLDNIEWVPGEGTIRLKQPGVLDEGTYQCFASNMYGTSMSNRAVLTRSLMASYPPGKPVITYLANLGDKLMVSILLSLYHPIIFRLHKTWLTSSGKDSY